MLFTALIAIIAFVLGYTTHLIKINRAVPSMIETYKEEIEKSFAEGSKMGWHMALDDKLMVASKYHEYFPTKN